MGENLLLRNFYSRMGYVLIALVLAGFIPFIKMRYDSGGSMNPALMLHGVVFISWFILFIFQASLIARKNIKLHMTLGKSSLVVALAMVITGVMMMQGSYDRGSSGGTPFSTEHFLILPFMDLVLFSITFPLAYINRKTALTHKHYMLLTGIMIMDPAIARLAMTLGFMPLGMVIHFGLLLAVILYDRKTVGKIHLATKVGVMLLIARYASLFLIGPTEIWAKFVHFLFG